ncbi:hypothetical protein BJX63DRAFT_131471 [Aspergillus granulosus]|uniref:Uncharacterized protein n=1 Tax=Aspergillus granulosus TaxID=176169 RepID=A0ABR4HN88_9EURO
MWRRNGRPGGISCDRVDNKEETRLTVAERRSNGDSLQEKSRRGRSWRESVIEAKRWRRKNHPIVRVPPNVESPSSERVQSFNQRKGRSNSLVDKGSRTPRFNNSCPSGLLELLLRLVSFVYSGPCGNFLFERAYSIVYSVCSSRKANLIYALGLDQPLRREGTVKIMSGVSNVR